MRFGRQLRRGIYKPWSDKYIDYDKLKQLLRDSGSDAGSPGAVADGDDDEPWTDEDEGKFVEELVNVQLEKVDNFHSETYKKLQERTSDCEDKLNPLGAGKEEDTQDHEAAQDQPVGGIRRSILEDALKELDEITKEVNELEKYSRINYTGFLKAGKKHDRKRGKAYRVRPLLQVRLAALPFYKEDYSPLLYCLSAMYSFVRQNLDGKDTRGMSFSESQTGGETFTSLKCKYTSYPSTFVPS